MALAFGWRADARARIEYFDPAFFEYSGLEPQDVYGSLDGWLKAVHPEDAERAAAMWQLGAYHLDRYDLEVRMRSRSGLYYTFHGVAVPVRRNGDVVGWEGTCTLAEG